MCVREVLCEDVRGVRGASFLCVWGPLYPSPAYIIVGIRRNCIQQGVPETSLSTSNFQTQFILYPHPARKSLVSYTLVWCQLLMIAQLPHRTRIRQKGRAPKKLETGLYQALGAKR